MRRCLLPRYCFQVQYRGFLFHQAHGGRRWGLLYHAAQFRFWLVDHIRGAEELFFSLMFARANAAEVYPARFG